MFEITETFPTPLLQDFRIFLDSLTREETILSPKNQYISKQRLWELNQLVSLKAVGNTPTMDQASYPLLHLFFHLAVSGKLARMTPGKGGRFRLEVTERYQEYLKLTLTEQYFYLLETLWIDADWRALQKAANGRGPSEYIIVSVWQTLAQAKPEKELDVKAQSSSWRDLLSDWGYFLYYFAYFGFWRFQVDEEAMSFSRRQIEALTLTPTALGVSLAAVLFQYRDYLDWNTVHGRRSELRSQDILDQLESFARSLCKKPQGFAEMTKSRRESLDEPFFQAFVPLFSSGELSHSLVRQQKKFKEGAYLLKVSWRRGVWRKILLAAKHTLEDLHLAIQEAFDFNDDHLYSFFMDNKKWSHDSYASPFDDTGPYADEVVLGDLALHPGQTFLYLFDYGDEWEFKVEVEEIDSTKPLPLKPQLVDQRGTAPEQYPDYDD